ncbi:MAG: PEP-CTERM sorting domain-containing protein [Phycisphaerales bacterium]|nr:MAG: PEP-CTERM sorting domain-containing protein [Phycisphaerales bacterium]
MKKTSVVSVVAVLLMATVTTAATVWNPAANGIVPPATGNWADAANWTNDVPGVADGKAVFNVPDAADCVVTDAQAFNQFVQGDNGPGGVIRVMDGGSLTTGAVWSAVGYNNTAHMIVETGGSVAFGEHMWIGLAPGSAGTLDINGGTVSVASMVGLGWDGGTGYVNVNDGGLLALSNIHGDGSSSIKGDSLLGINGTGAITLPNDFVGVIETYAGAGLIAGDGIPGNVQASFADGVTTVVVPEPASIILLGLGGLLLRRKK